MLSKRIDKLVDMGKWPIAWLSTLALPLLIWSTLRLIWDALCAPWNIAWFVAGVVAFGALWKSWMARGKLGTWLIHWEHEFTHLIFAVLTCHPILGFRASAQQGSHVRFLGKGNWLITASPYFFPTAALVLWVASWLLPIRVLPWTSLVLGFAIGYHVVSTIHETHRDQTDLQQLTWRFCWLFLPAANLLFVGILLSYSYGGSEAVSDYFSRMLEPIAYLIDRLQSPMHRETSA